MADFPDWYRNHKIDEARGRRRSRQVTVLVVGINAVVIVAGLLALWLIWRATFHSRL